MPKETLNLLVLVADRKQEAGIKTLIKTRQESLGVRQINYKFLSNPHHDCATNDVIIDILRSFLTSAEFALVVLDYEGSGREDKNPGEIEEEIKEALERSGWKERVEVVVIVPELEMWVWSDSPHVDDILGWTGKSPALRFWLKQQGWLENEALKPDQPKEALEDALREVREPFSAAIFKELAEKVSIRRCRDQSFLKLKQILQNWFPARTNKRKRPPLPL